MIRKFLLFLFFVFLAFLGSILVDRFLGFYLNKTGYFKAMVPNITQIYNAKEFNMVAKISSQGLRNDEVKVPKPKNTFRILAVGDSFTYGWGVPLEKSWVKLLEKRLIVKGKKVEVINAGDPGADLDEDIKICKAYNPRLDPDAILFGIFVNNPYQTAYRESITPKIMQYIRQYWPTLTDVKSPIILDIYQSNFRSDNASNSSSINTPLSLVDHNALNFILNSTGKRISSFKTCTGRLPVVVVLIPFTLYISDTYQPFRTLYKYIIENELITFNIDNPLKNMVEKEGFYYISSLPDFRRDKCKDCYYKQDFHFNEKGNKIFTDFIAPKIQKLLDSILPG